MKDNVLDSESFSNSNSASIIPRLDSLPPELLQQIVSISESRAKSILCLICKSISTISNESLYRTVLLNSSSKVRLLAKSLNNQSSPSSSSASRSKCKDEDAAYQSDLPNLYHLLIASQDGLMSPNETITIQKEWSPSLKSIFTSDNSLTLRTVALISRPSGAALESFLSKHTGARPNNVSIYRLSVSTPPFSILDLNPLSQVTHFNLVQILPTEPLLDFFKCKPSTHDSQSQELHSQQQRHHHPLTHLRLSEVDPQCLLDFGDYINWRKAFDLWESQQKTSSSSSEAPKAPLVPSRRFSSQESLFSLASTIPHLPDFKLLMIEITKLPGLEKPSGLNLETGEESGENGSLQTMDWSSTLPASLQEERDWREREERNRTWERDLFWLKLREGLVELKGLIEENLREFKKSKGKVKSDDQDEIRKAQEDGDDDIEDRIVEESGIEVRLVIPRARGWVEDEIIKDFKSQTFEREAFEFQSQFNKGDQSDLHSSSSKVEFGCWRDQDIFEISQNRPWLSYAAKDQDESDYARGGKSNRKDKDVEEERDELGTLKDWRRKGDQSWWTGELPRMDAGRERTPFDFQS